MKLGYTQLLIDLHTAYLDARRHKRNRGYQQRFEANLQANLEELATELYNRTYTPRPSTCFIIEDPKKREVFAADFRDRIVHHLYYNYTHEFFERRFIADSYSCIKGRGTHYGISRMERHIRQASLGYTERAYVMKIDIRGYFMHINRNILLDICLRHIHKMDIRSVDIDFLEYLTREIVLLNPMEGCRIKGNRSDWATLPHDKSLFHSAQGCGLPIGNLTSQLFSNIYLNEFDQYVKRELKCRHYGRYVDDAYIVSPDKEWLQSLLPQLREFLLTRLGLEIHDGKLCVCEVHSGVEFLGAYLKPWRKYIRNATLNRIRRKVALIDIQAKSNDDMSIRLRDVLSSFGGIMGHYKTYRIRRLLFMRMRNVWRYGSFDGEWRKFGVWLNLPCTANIIQLFHFKILVFLLLALIG